MDNFSEKVSFIWSVADRLRGDFKQHQYGDIILPFTVLRRLDQVLQPTKNDVAAAMEKYKDKKAKFRHSMLLRAAKVGFYNASPYNFASLLQDPDNIVDNLHSYITNFSPNVRLIMEKFKVANVVDELGTAGILYTVIQRFNDINLDPYQRNQDGSIAQDEHGQNIDNVTNLEMGYIYEELIRKFFEQANETAGEHFTPREVIRLMVNLLFIEDNDVLTKAGIVRTMYDSCCGTGGMLSVAEKYLDEMNPKAKLVVYGQELNPSNFALCKADMLIKGHNAENIYFGSSLREDQMQTRVDYCISNPPFGVDWLKDFKAVQAEYESKGWAGRFGPGTPRKSDGSLLFLLHLLSKLKTPDEGGGRLAIVLNGSPLFTGSAGSGESEIRKYVFENDLLEAIIALPTDMFYNTGISTYVWILSNKKNPLRKGKVALINGVNLYQSMRKSLGSKRKELSDEHIQQITQMYGDMMASDTVKIFKNEDFGYSRIIVERPLRLRFQVTEEKLQAVQEDSKVQGLLEGLEKEKKKLEAEIEKYQTLDTLVSTTITEWDITQTWSGQKEFWTSFSAKFPPKTKISSDMQKAIYQSVGQSNADWLKADKSWKSFAKKAKDATAILEGVSSWTADIKYDTVSDFWTAFQEASNIEADIPEKVQNLLYIGIGKGRMGLVKQSKGWQKLQDKKSNLQTKYKKKCEEKPIEIVLTALEDLGDAIIEDRAIFLSTLESKFPEGFSLNAGITAAVWKSVGERCEEAEPCKDKDGNFEPDTSLRDNENVPLTESIEDYMKREVLPHVPDAWVDESKTVVGYEIPFTRHFYVYEPPRALESIEEDLLTLEKQIAGLTAEVLG